MRFLLLLLLMCFGAGAVAAELGLKLTPAEQTETHLTVYRDFALVRDVRESVLPMGRIQIEFEGVASTIDPASVRVVADTLNVVEQSYHYDLLNKSTLLDRYIGRKLKYTRSLLQENTYEKVLREGVLLAMNPEIVQFGDEIEIAPEGVISLPYVPEGLRTTPTLIWIVDNDGRGLQKIETSYLATGISWRADYLLLLNTDENRFDLTTWVSLDNQSNIAFAKTGVALVAGEVRRVAQAPQPPVRMLSMRAEMASADSVAPAALPDYYVYQMPGRFDLERHETKQLRLMEAERVPVAKSYFLETGVPTYQVPEPMSNHFDIRYSFDNVSRHRLGLPLPAGRVRVFSSASGEQTLLGEAPLAHTPAGERVDLTIGKAFDLTAERTQKSFRRLGDRVVETTWEVSLANRKSEPAVLILHEKLYGDWEIVMQTQSGKKADSTTQEYIVELDGGSERTFSYTARIRF